MRSIGRLTLAHKCVLVLAALTLVLGLSNVGRAIVALRYVTQLPALHTRMPLGYAVAVGGFWGLVFTVGALGLFLFCTWARPMALGAVTLYQANIWTNHILFDASDYAHQTRARDLVLTAILLILYWGTLNLRLVRRMFSAPGNAGDRRPDQGAYGDRQNKEIDGR